MAWLNFFLYCYIVLVTKFALRNILRTENLLFLLGTIRHFVVKNGRFYPVFCYKLSQGDCRSEKSWKVLKNGRSPEKSWCSEKNYWKVLNFNPKLTINSINVPERSAEVLQKNGILTKILLQYCYFKLLFHLHLHILYSSF